MVATMTAVAHIVDGSADTFVPLVIDNSRKGLVLVNYWSPKVGPCLRVWEVLEKLNIEFGGRFLLVNINTDKEGILARETGVNSLPTVKLFRNGQVVDEVHGAESEQSFRQRIEKQLPGAVEAIVQHAVNQFHHGDRSGAFTILEQLLQAEPENPLVPITYGRLLVTDGQWSVAERMLLQLPEALRQQREVDALLIHVGFLVASQDAPSTVELDRLIADHPDNRDARYQRAAVALVADDYDQALEQLLAIVEQDRQWRQGIARKGMLVILDVLEADHPLADKYFTRLSNVLNS